MAERLRKAAGKAGAEARICDAVRAAILERRLAPGTKLQEIPLGAFFGVSRTIVRQALRTLAHEGIVALRDRRVAVVARPSAADVANVFAARRAIEAAVVEHVCARITRAEIAALRDLVRDEEAAYRAGDRARGLKLSLAFHRRLAALCGNPVLERYLTELVLQTSLAVALYERPDRTHAHADHVELAAAIGRRDAKRAVRLMTGHLADLERDLHVDAAATPPSLAAIFGNP
ncbi:MAG: GntR family transcriptional regulator [Burkholderiales bacterium]